MVEIDVAATLLMSLPQVGEGMTWANRTWSVDGKKFAWVRPLSKADIKRIAPQQPPTGPLLALSTEDLHDRDAILSMNRPGVFSIAHFDKYPAYLIQLDVVPLDVLNDSIVDAWLAVAPDDLAQQYLRDHPT